MTHKSKSWTRIKNLGKSKKDLDLTKLFKKDDTRGISFNASIADIELDFSKSKITKKALMEFEKLAKELDLQGKIFDLLQGKITNNTEKRSVGHVWLRSRNFRPKSILANNFNHNTYYNLGFDVDESTTQVTKTNYKTLSKILGIIVKSTLEWIKQNKPDVVTMIPEGGSDKEFEKNEYINSINFNNHFRIRCFSNRL